MEKCRRGLNDRILPSWQHAADPRPVQWGAVAMPVWRPHPADRPHSSCRAGQAYDSTQRSIFQETVDLTAMAPHAPGGGDDDEGATEYLRLRLLATVAGTDRGFAVNSRQAAEVAAAAEALASAGGAVDLTSTDSARQLLSRKHPLVWHIIPWARITRLTGLQSGSASGVFVL